MQKRLFTKFAAVVALAIAFARIPTAAAEELPSEGGCTGNLYESTPGSHCCLYNSCGNWWEPWNTERTNGHVYEVYHNPGCTQTVHTGGMGGCC